MVGEVWSTCTSPTTLTFRTHRGILTRVRYRVETVFGQLVDRCGLKRIWARDLWHLRNRTLRLPLMHTMVILFNQQEGHPPLQLATLVA